MTNLRPHPRPRGRTNPSADEGPTDETGERLSVAEEPFAAANAPQAFLYTGHKTIGVGESAKYEAFWKKIGIRYLVNLNVFGKPDDPTKTGFKVVYRSKSSPNQIWVVSTEP